MSHPWNVSASEAIAIQKTLREKVKVTLIRTPIKTIAGVDVSLQRFSKELFAGVVVLSFPELIPIDQALVKTTVTFPYIPGLLSFREIPGILECFKRLKVTPDVVVVDGQGIAHPRRLGIASHLGVLLNIPTVGCAKSNLYGIYTPPKNTGDESPLIDPKTMEQIGIVLKSKERSLPLVISPGHKITIKEAGILIKQCLCGYRLPEPTRLAHNLVNRFRRGELS